MHIADGILRPEVIAVTNVAAIGAVAFGADRCRRLGVSRARTVATLGTAAAALFVASSVPLPAWPGTSAHALGTPFAALLLGPWAAVALTGLVVFLQALVGHGGISAWGADTLTMGLIAPLVAWLSYRGAQRMGMPKMAAGIAASALGCAATYLTTAAIIAYSIAHQPSGFLGMFTAVALSYLPAELPMIAVESVLTGMALVRLEQHDFSRLMAPGGLRVAERRVGE